MAEDAAPAWVVTQQVETTDLGPDGVYQAGVKVSFRTASGALGSVFIPHAGYSVEAVRAAVAERAATLDAVAALKG